MNCVEILFNACARAAIRNEKFLGLHVEYFYLTDSFQYKRRVCVGSFLCLVLKGGKKAIVQTEWDCITIRYEFCGTFKKARKTFFRLEENGAIVATEKALHRLDFDSAREFIAKRIQSQKQAARRNSENALASYQNEGKPAKKEKEPKAKKELRNLIYNAMPYGFKKKESGFISGSDLIFSIVTKNFELPNQSEIGLPVRDFGFVINND